LVGSGEKKVFTVARERKKRERERESERERKGKRKREERILGSNNVPFTPLSLPFPILCTQKRALFYFLRYKKKLKLRWWPKKIPESHNSPFFISTFRVQTDFGSPLMYQWPTYQFKYSTIPIHTSTLPSRREREPSFPDVHFLPPLSFPSSHDTIRNPKQARG